MFLFSVFLAATAAIGYEILAATALVNLLGSSVLYFSLTIGVYLAALGFGSWLSARIRQDPDSLLKTLIYIEASVAVLGGGLSAIFYWLYGFIIDFIRNSQFQGFNGLLLGIGLGEIVFNLLAFGFLFAVGVLVGFELPLFSRFLSTDEKLGQALGRVFFWDYAGALVASVSLPILLFPVLGILKTSFVLGLLNVLAAAILLLVLYRRQTGKNNFQWRLFLVLAAALAVNLAGFMNGDFLELYFERRVYVDREILYHKQTPFQSITYTRDDYGKISLYLSGQLQFESGDWEGTYHESLVHPAFVARCQSSSANRQSLIAGCQGLKILILGGGDGLALREVLKYPETALARLVDIDSEMVRVSKEYDFIRSLNGGSFFDDRAEVVIADAYKFVEQDREKYDIILVDLPDAHDPSLSRLYSREFYFNVGRRLNDGGVAVIQSAGYLTPPHQVILKSVEAAGLNVLAYRSADLGKDNIFFSFGFTMVSRKPIQTGDFQDKEIKAPTRILKSENLTVIFEPPPDYFSQDYSDYEAKANSIFRPTIIESQGSIFAQRYFNVVSFGHAIRQTSFVIFRD